MRINWETPVDELYHGDNIAYIDLDEDEICHWKYIKREKLPNGKWRYFYNQSELDQYKMIANRANAAADQSADKLKNAKIKESRAEANLENAKRRLKTARARGKLVTETHNVRQAGKNLRTATKERTVAEKAYEEASKIAKKKERQYNTKAVTSFPARTIAKGAVKVANFFSGSNLKKPKKKTKSKSRVTYSASTSLKYTK